jgi:hypothetical protein
MGPIGYPETLVRNYQFWRRNNPEEHISQLLRCRSLKSLVDLFFVKDEPSFACSRVFGTGIKKFR